MTHELTALTKQHTAPRPPSRGLMPSQEVPGQARDGTPQ